MRKKRRDQTVMMKRACYDVEIMNENHDTFKLLHLHTPFFPWLPILDCSGFVRAFSFMYTCIHERSAACVQRLLCRRCISSLHAPMGVFEIFSPIVQTVTIQVANLQCARQHNVVHHQSTSSTDDGHCVFCAFTTVCARLSLCGFRGPRVRGESLNIVLIKYNKSTTSQFHLYSDAIFPQLTLVLCESPAIALLSQKSFCLAAHLYATTTGEYPSEKHSTAVILNQHSIPGAIWFHCTRGVSVHFEEWGVELKILLYEDVCIIKNRSFIRLTLR